MKTKKSTPRLWTSLALLSALATGCGYQNYHPQPLAAQEGLVNFRTHDPESEGFLEYMHAQGYEHSVESWGLRELTLSALYFHPDLDIARAQLGQAMADITTAGQRPNPSAAGSLGRSEDPEGRNVYSFSVSIPIETAGKRQARLDQAVNLSEAARASIGQSIWTIRSRLLLSWIDYNAALQNLSTLEEEVLLRDAIVSMLKQRLDAGMISNVELSNARLQWQKSRQTLATEQGRIQELKSALASNAGLPLVKFEQLPLNVSHRQEVLEASHPINIANIRSTATQDAALLNRLDILASLARYAASEARLRLEIAKQYPDINLIPSYSYEEGFHIWSLGISSILNLMHKNQGQIAQAKALRETEAAQFEALQARIIANMDTARTRYETSVHVLEQAQRLYQAQINQSEQASRRFDNGFADRLEFSVSQLERVLALQNLLSSEYQVQRAAAALEDSMQLPLENLDSMPADLERAARKYASGEEKLQ
ncbi:TolC family protein [Methylobacillus caricis]|uniref:TolC family protein n=1 Tax=Methylobacillus caricis TaxID=1971611 RepID=UPI001CFF899C|nr:TolC family protein [Methylobacillus caricis]MCB5187306.1 TolC family protein [Methylobacillus caricis]